MIKQIVSLIVIISLCIPLPVIAEEGSGSIEKNSIVAFDDINNFNVVKSIVCIDGKRRGFNFGKCDYILALYKELTARGESVYICKCGFDDENPAHCITCAACRTCKYVLFVLHSTPDYDAKKDALFPVLKEIVMNQPDIIAD